MLTTGSPRSDDMNPSGLVVIDEHLSILELSVASLERQIQLHVYEQRQTLPQRDPRPDILFRRQ